MRGVRGGLKDQVKAFRLFLRRRKKKRIEEQKKIKQKYKKGFEEKKKKEVFISSTEFILNDIEDKLINGKQIDLIKTDNMLGDFKKDKSNVHILDKIEEVKQKVEVEIIFEEIVKPKTKLQVMTSNIDNKKENVQIQKFINLSSNIINKANNEVEINHYFNMVNKLYHKHSKEKKIITNTKLDKYIVLEKDLLFKASEKKQVINSNKSIRKNYNQNVKKETKSQDDVLNKKIEESNQPLEEVVQVVDVNKNIEVLKNNSEEVLVVEDVLEVPENQGVLKKDEVGQITEYINGDEPFNTEEFEIINQLVVKQIVFNEQEVNKLKGSIKDIKNIFEEKSGFDRFLDFSKNLINLGRGLIGKHIFSNSLVRRLNSEVLINNSLKGIHRAFADEKQEISYIVFESFQKDINDKKDCAIKINDICEDSLDEVKKLKLEFLAKYGNIQNEKVNEFIHKFDCIESDLLKRQEEAKKIEKQAIQQYKKNYQKVKIKK
ncbi:MAG: hypothetical protein J6D28_04050 [Bacilli bacterium]|nr:hypothetical protein [Bacilli bacterium]